jgi:pimeloyl-ACP methyl ester carboxylesterase
MTYAPVNGLDMYYEIHGTPVPGTNPLVLLHGALSATGTSFGPLLEGLAKTRQVIAVEQQAHGRTADIDRPLRMEQMAADTAALLDHVGVARADIFGYSLGAGIAAYVALDRPDLVGKLVLAAISINNGGFHPGVLDGIDMLTPEMMAGSPFAEEYARLAPRPGDWATLVEKTKDLDRDLPQMAPETFASIAAPMLIVIGDSDIIRPEHAVELFRLVGGGVMGDGVGMPASRLAILPGTSHITIPAQADLLLPMIPAFLDAPAG